MAVKNELKKLRKEQRLKQSDLTMAVGMCEKSISNIELEKNPASLETALWKISSIWRKNIPRRKCDDNTP